MCSLFMGGCFVPRKICLPIEGTVVDAETGKPVSTVKILVSYTDSSEMSVLTDSQGRYRFGARYKLIPVLVNVHLDRVSGFVGLHVGADGYQSVSYRNWHLAGHGLLPEKIHRSGKDQDTDTQTPACRKNSVRIDCSFSAYKIDSIRLSRKDVHGASGQALLD